MPHIEAVYVRLNLLPKLQLKLFLATTTALPLPLPLSLTMPHHPSFEGLDFEYVAEEAWNKLVLWYGLTANQQPICRLAILDHGVMRIEIKLLALRCLQGVDESTIRDVTFSKFTLISTVKAHICDIFSLPNDETSRLWELTGMKGQLNFYREISTLTGKHCRSHLDVSISYVPLVNRARLTRYHISDHSLLPTGYSDHISLPPYIWRCIICYI